MIDNLFMRHYTQYVINNFTQEEYANLSQEGKADIVANILHTPLPTDLDHSTLIQYESIYDSELTRMKKSNRLRAQYMEASSNLSYIKQALLEAEQRYDRACEACDSFGDEDVF